MNSWARKILANFLVLCVAFATVAVRCHHHDAANHICMCIVEHVAHHDCECGEPEEHHHNEGAQACCDGWSFGIIEHDDQHSLIEKLAQEEFLAVLTQCEINDIPILIKYYKALERPPKASTLHASVIRRGPPAII